MGLLATKLVQQRNIARNKNVNVECGRFCLEFIRRTMDGNVQSISDIWKRIQVDDRTTKFPERNLAHGFITNEIFTTKEKWRNMEWKCYIWSVLFDLQWTEMYNRLLTYAKAYKLRIVPQSHRTRDPQLYP